MVVHRDQAEEVVIGLGHRLRRPVLVDGADLELLEVAAVGVSARRLALGLVGGQLVVLVAHRLRVSPRVVRLQRAADHPADQPLYPLVAGDREVTVVKGLAPVDHASLLSQQREHRPRDRDPQPLVLAPPPPRPGARAARPGSARTRPVPSARPRSARARRPASARRASAPPAAPARSRERSGLGPWPPIPSRAQRAFFRRPRASVWAITWPTSFWMLGSPSTLMWPWS